MASASISTAIFGRARATAFTASRRGGDLIGKIPVPEKVANVCFGGPTRDRLYICGHTSLYAIHVNTRGAQAPWVGLFCRRGKPRLAGRWERVTRHESFEWKTKRDAMRIKISDEGYLITFPPALPILAESEGYKPADLDRRIDISGDSGSTVEIDENMLLDAMPDFIPFLPRE
jgi:hypothetical protein